MKAEQYNLHNDMFYTVGFRGSDKKCDEIIGEVTDVFTQSLKDVYTAHHGPTTGEALIKTSCRIIEDDLALSTTTGTLLKKHDDKSIVGFIYAYPSPKRNLYKKEFEERNIPPSKHDGIVKKTAEVGWAVILEDYRGQGGWSLMMNNLEIGLNTRKEFDYHTRFVRKDNGYAEKIRQRYKENIIYESTYDNRTLGEQAYFRIRLGEKRN